MPTNKTSTTEDTLTEPKKLEEAIPVAGYITSLPEEMIRNLKPEDLERMITLKMAAEGIQIIDKPQEPTYHVIPEKDVTLYQLVGLKYAFTRLEDAQKVAQVLIPLSMYMRGNEWFSDDTVERMNLKEYGNEPFTITPQQAYSAALYAQIKDAREENKRLKQNYEKKLKEYEDAHEGARWVRDEVWGKFREVEAKYEEMDRLLEQYKNYVKIAEGNEEFAWKFLKKAFAISTEQETYIKAHFVPKTSSN